MTHHTTVLSVTNNICVFCQSSYCSFNKSLSLFSLSLGLVYRLHNNRGHPSAVQSLTDNIVVCRTQLNLAPLNWSSAAAGKVPLSNVDNMTLHTADEPDWTQISKFRTVMFKQHPSWQILRELELPKILDCSSYMQGGQWTKEICQNMAKERKQTGIIKVQSCLFGHSACREVYKFPFFNLAHHSQRQISEGLKDLRGIWWIDYLSQTPWLGIKSQRTRHFYQDSRGA